MLCSVSDFEKVSRVLDDDNVYIPVHGCRCANPGELAKKMLSADGIYVLMPNEGSVLIFVPYNKDIYNVHIGFLPGFRGRSAVAACLDAFSWMFANTPCVKIIGFELKKRRDAIRFIGLLGVDREGVLKNVDGKGNDMIVFGHCKPCA